MGDLTEQSLTEVMLEAAQLPVAPRVKWLVMSPVGAAFFKIMQLAETENWDRRRRKRELKRPLTSNYHRHLSV